MPVEFLSDAEAAAYCRFDGDLSRVDLLDVPESARVSGLERWRKGPAEPSGKNLKLALARVAEIHGVGIDAAAVRALVPTRRLVDVARYGMAAKAPASPQRDSAVAQLRPSRRAAPNRPKR